jgi:predicted DNA-binding protein (MmcQ/YjbR family)
VDIEVLRTICLSFPAVTEDVKWGNDLCFCVGGKMFCVTNLEPPHTFSFKVTDAEFEEVSQAEGFKPAPYMARAKWVLVTDSSKLSRKDLKNYLQQSYELITAKFSRKQRKELGIE